MSLQRPTETSQRPATGGSTALLLICAVTFIWISGRALPDIVASHVAASGIATGFMPRALCLRLTLMLVLVVPLSVNILTRLSLRSAGVRVNLPNREYWFAPERRSESVDFVRRHVARLCVILVAFFCYVHWLVVHANALTPPTLSPPWFIAGLLAFLLSGVIWAVIFRRRFRAGGNG